MKRILFLLGIALLLGSCSKESTLPAPISQEGTVSMLSFKVGLPAGDPVTYAIQTDAEKLVRRFDIYQFGEGADGLLEATYLNVPLTTTGTGYTANVGIQGAGKKQFFFVANNMGGNAGGATSIENLTNGSIKAEAFQKLLTKTLAPGSALVSPLLMTGHLPSVDVQAAPAATPRQTVELTRIMSRLDIRNFEPRLTINRVRLERSADRSFVFHQTTGSQNPTGVKLIALPEATLPIAPVSGNVPIEMEHVTAAGGVLAHTFYKHVFYPYVRDEVANEADAPLLVIEGTLFKGDPEREAKVVYRKPLKVSGKTNFLGFARNTRYTFVIEKAISGEMTGNLKVDKWNEESVDAPLEVSVPTPTEFYGWWDYTEGRVTLALPVVTVRKDFISDIFICVSSNTDWEVFPEGSETVPADGQMTDWLKALPVNTYWGTTIPQNTLKTELQLNLTANNSGAERSIRLVLRSKADNNKQYILTVKQGA